MFNGEKCADQIDLQDLQPVLHGLFEKRRGNKTAAYSRVRINDIEPAKASNGAIDVSFDVVLVAGVGGNGLHVATMLRHRLCGVVQGFGFLIDDDRPGALAREQNRAGPADAACCTGDNRNLTFEPAHRPPPLAAIFYFELPVLARLP